MPGKPVVAMKRDLIEWVDEILLNEWDPIGIQDVPQCSDEYSCYATSVAEMVARRIAPELIASHLDNIATQRMGLEPDPEHTYRVALLLLGPFSES